MGVDRVGYFAKMRARNMKISDLIKALHEIKDVHGDVEVALLADDGKQVMAYSIYTEQKGPNEIVVIS